MSRFMILGMLVSMPVFAPSAAAQNEVVTGLLECRQITEADRRLACFDALAGEYGPRAGGEAGQTDADAGEAGTRDERVAGEPVTPKAGTESPKPGIPDRDSPVKAGDTSPGSSPGAGSPGDREAARIASAEDLPLPYEGRIKAFASNARGDYRFRIGGGIVFERAGGPGVPGGDLTGAGITLSKNFLGQWRARVEGQPRELWVSPVRR